MVTHPLLRSRFGAVPAVTAAGARSMFRHWMGGVSATPVSTGPGMRSMFRHWMGGTGALASTDDGFLDLLTLLACIAPVVLDQSQRRVQPSPQPRNL